eukprot:9502316-Pyramimonas_sp.AAC.2
MGFWLVNLLSSKRYLLTTLRKSDECQCGCRGWCSVFPILSCIRWQLESMALGTRPDSMHDLKPWPPGQEPTQRQLSYSAMLLFVKGDWAEHSKTLALAPCNQNDNCCQFCEMNRFDRHDCSHFLSHDSDEQLPLRDHDDYEKDVQKCEIKVHVASVEQLQSLVSSLRWFKPIKRNAVQLRGRCIYKDVTIGGVVLALGDRLEPSADMTDIAYLGRRTPPFDVTFWRARTHGARAVQLDSVHHRCPLFSSDVLCTSPARTLAIDAMHCLHLGIAMRCVAACLWRTILANPWGFNGGESHKQDLGLRQLWGELKAWQEQHVPQNERLHMLTAKMMGSSRGHTTEDQSVIQTALCSCSFATRMPTARVNPRRRDGRGSESYAACITSTGGKLVGPCVRRG